MSTIEILRELRRLTPAERAEVQAKLGEWSAETAHAAETPSSERNELMSDPAFGIWRSDLPGDAVDAVAELRRQSAVRRRERLRDRG